MQSNQVVNPKELVAKGKLPLHLWPTTATVYGCLGFLDGSGKYGRSNYRASRVKSSTYYDAALRHLFAWFEGEDFAPDSGVPHLGHALACLALLIDAGEAGMLEDDRMYPGGFEKTVENLTPLVDQIRQRHAEKTVTHFTKDSV